jgi:class 3 adenylate cyclase/predicted ATPase
MNAAGEQGSQESPPERRYLTIVFVDLVGYTELSEQLEPEDLLALSSRYRQLALAVMERFGGFVANFTGDGVLVYFGYPAAHGNDAERALRAALEMVERLSSLDIPLSEGTARRLAARIGVHTGLVIVGPELMSYGSNIHGIVGEAANLAARLQSEAQRNEVVVSRNTKDLVEDLFEFTPLGARLLKGLSRPVEAFQVIKARPAAEYERVRRLRGSTSMVGRVAALDQMLACWKGVREQSHCRVLIVVGDAGLGKTRLVKEFFLHPALGPVAVAQTYCFEIFANTAFFPVASYLWNRIGLTLEDDENARRLKFSRMLDEYGLLNDENLDVLETFQGLTTGPAELTAPTTQLTKLKQYRLVIDLVERVARERPTIVCLEDVHWLDPSSAELLVNLAAELVNVPLLIVLTARSYPKGPTLPVPNEVIYLEPLAKDDCLKIARSVPGARDLPPALLARAVATADGVPLFVEQLVRSLVDQRERNNYPGRKSLELPLILAEIMSERLDRLPGGRRVVQAAACLGRSFRPEFLAALLQQDIQQISETLKLLVEAEILQPRRHGVELQYEFHHALLQRMARDSMIEPDRRAMHAQIVDMIHTQSNVPVPLEVAAYHLTEAGAFPDAVRAWYAAGLHSAKHSAHREAIDHLRKGLTLLDKIQDEKLRREFEINLQAALIGSVNITQGPTSAELSNCCERGLQLCREAGQTQMVFPFVFGKFTYANCRGRVEEAKSLAELFLSHAEDRRYEAGRVVGHRLRGMCRLGQGDAAAARVELEASLQLYSHERDAASTDLFGQNTMVHSRSLLALAMFCLGEVESAFRLGRDVLLAADALRHPNSTALALSYVGCYVLGFCSPSHLMHSAKRLIRIADHHRLGGFRAHGTAFLGWAYCERGELAQGIEAIYQAVRRFDAVEYRLGVAGHLTNLAEAQLRIGELAPAKASVARAKEMMFESGCGWLEPEVRRIEALIEAQLSPQSGSRAVEMLRQAAQRAQEMGSPVFERRCLLSLYDNRAVLDDRYEIDRRLEATVHLGDLNALANNIIGAADTLPSEVISP